MDSTQLWRFDFKCSSSINLELASFNELKLTKMIGIYWPCSKLTSTQTEERWFSSNPLFYCFLYWLNNIRFTVVCLSSLSNPTNKSAGGCPKFPHFPTKNRNPTNRKIKIYWVDNNVDNVSFYPYLWFRISGGSRSQEMVYRSSGWSGPSPQQTNFVQNLDCQQTNSTQSGALSSFICIIIRKLGWNWAEKSWG